MKGEVEALEATIADKDKELAFAEKRITKLEEELAKLRAGAIAERKPVATEAPEEEQLSIEVEVEPAIEEAPQKKKQSRNKVGSMFDLLTFSDI